jgi:hypothetical protein
MSLPLLHLISYFLAPSPDPFPLADLQIDFLNMKKAVELGYNYPSSPQMN